MFCLINLWEVCGKRTGWIINCQLAFGTKLYICGISIKVSSCSNIEHSKTKVSKTGFVTRPVDRVTLEPTVHSLINQFNFSLKLYHTNTFQWMI